MTTVLEVAPPLPTTATSLMPSETIYPSYNTVGCFSRKDALSYLNRLEFTERQEAEELLSRKPSLELLKALQCRHIETVPFETSALHFPANVWNSDNVGYELGIGRSGEPVRLGADAFHRIVTLRRGGYCFALNSTFATLLRCWGFRVSELAAKVNARLNEDPDRVGWHWKCTSHECLVVDWPESGGKRYFVDIGFGANQPCYPIELRDGATADKVGLPNVPSHRLMLNQEGILGQSHFKTETPDQLPYWTLFRLSRSIEPSNKEGKDFWTPLYTFVLQTIAYQDFVVLNHYNSTHRDASFTPFFVCTKLMRGRQDRQLQGTNDDKLLSIDAIQQEGNRVTLYYKEPMEGLEPEHGEKKYARMTTTDARGCVVESKSRWIEMKVGTMKPVLENTFNFYFPEEYREMDKNPV